MGIIALSGKKQSGKDTVGKIINILLNSPQLNNKGVLNFLEKDIITDKSYYYNEWEIKKFADKLKDIVCLLIGCTREQLEDEEFKSKELNEEWNVLKVTYKIKEDTFFDKIYNLLDYSCTKETENIEEYYESIGYELIIRKVIYMTPRLMLQLLGTECGRQIIHPQIWCLSTFEDYKINHIDKDFLDMNIEEAEILGLIE